MEREGIRRPSHDRSRLGQYNSYLDGEIDGVPHWDEAQKDRHGEMILHGKKPVIPYMVPTISFGRFIADRIRIAVDAGVEAIHLEEPEFWVNGGYSEAFRREWQLYYKEPWIPPHATPDAQYRASKLKAYLYTRVLDRLCAEMKDYALKRYDRILRFYVPTHSLINYTQWRIVSPQSALVELSSIDGYIAQIWTGTSRTPNVYEGLRKERTFETAYLEYGVMQELVRGTDRRMWFLHDPIEDNPNHTWADYKQNYLKPWSLHCCIPGSPIMKSRHGRVESLKGLTLPRTVRARSPSRPTMQRRCSRSCIRLAIWTRK